MAEKSPSRSIRKLWKNRLPKSGAIGQASAQQWQIRRKIGFSETQIIET
ncbi:MAG: hypothetical protein ACR65O_10665 [Methylomicrobium sp.]